MRATIKMLPALVFMAAFATMAHAESFSLGTWASTSTNPGFQNTAVLYEGYNPVSSNGPFLLNSTSNATYDLGSPSDVNPWSPAIPPSQWISKDPGSTVNGGSVDPNGYYKYQTTFTSDGQYWGQLGLLADDTMEVFLDGNLLQTFAINDPNGPCAQGGGGPTCVGNFYAPMNFGAGTHTLTFIDWQSNGSAMGIDAEGSFATPEPGSLALLGTGLLGLAMMMRRVVA